MKSRPLKSLSKSTMNTNNTIKQQSQFAFGSQKERKKERKKKKESSSSTTTTAHRRIDCNTIHRLVPIGTRERHLALIRFIINRLTGLRPQVRSRYFHVQRLVGTITIHNTHFGWTLPILYFSSASGSFVNGWYGMESTLL